MISSRLVWSAWLAAARRDHRAYLRALRDPDRAQRRLLRRILRAAERSRVGRRCGFASIDSPSAFARRVPLTAYDELEPEIEAIRSGVRGVLTGEPVLRLVPSGGSGGAAKLLPFTRTLGRDFARAVSAWVVDLAAQHPGVTRGRGYWSVSPAMDSPATPAAVPIGFESDAAYLGRGLAPLVSRALVAPAALAQARPLESFRYASLLHLLAAPDLALISIWHPSFLTLLLEPRDAHWEQLIEDIREGRCRPPVALPEPVAVELERRLRPGPRRADELAALGPRAELDQLWPNLALVSAWGDAAAHRPFVDLQTAAGAVAVQAKGLLATEAVVSLPFQSSHPLAVSSTYLELIDPAGHVVGVGEARPGGEYEVAVTTSGGLYRYRLGDVVRMDGRVGATPSVRLVGRSDRVVDQCGEKLSESFVAAAVCEAYDREVLPSFAMLAPQDGRYWLFVDRPPSAPARLLERLTRALRRSPTFAYAQDLGQLGPLALVVTGPDPGRRYLAWGYESGQTLGSIKPTHLAREANWRQRLGGRVVAVDDSQTTNERGETDEKEIDDRGRGALAVGGSSGHPGSGAARGGRS